MQTIPKKGNAKRIIKILVLMVIVGLGLFFFLNGDYKEFPAQAATFIRDLGWKGMFLYGTLYFLLGIFSLPASLITISAGYLFGFFPGILIANIGSTLGAALMFLVGRFLFRGFVERQEEKFGFLKTFDSLVEKRGLKIVILTRLAIFMPYGLLNYGFSASKIKLGVFVVGSLLGMLPGSILYVIIGTSLENISDMASIQINPSTIAQSHNQNLQVWYGLIMGIGLISMLILVYYLGKISTLALKSMGKNQNEIKSDSN